MKTVHYLTVYLTTKTVGDVKIAEHACESLAAVCSAMVDYHVRFTKDAWRFECRTVHHTVC